jgi:hypothetical protein
VPDRAEAWREILCVIEERTVGNDNTIAWAGRRLQLPESRLRPHFVKARVHLHEYPDNSVSVFLGPHRLASYDGHGALLSSPTASSLAACSAASRDGLHSAARVDRPAPRPPLTRPAPAAASPAQVGTWRNRGVTTAGTGWPPRNAKGARPCPRASSMSASMYH